MTSSSHAPTEHWLSSFMVVVTSLVCVVFVVILVVVAAKLLRFKRKKVTQRIEQRVVTFERGSLPYIPKILQPWDGTFPARNMLERRFQSLPVLQPLCEKQKSAVHNLSFASDVCAQTSARASRPKGDSTLRGLASELSRQHLTDATLQPRQNSEQQNNNHARARTVRSQTGSERLNSTPATLTSQMASRVYSVTRSDCPDRHLQLRLDLEAERRCDARRAGSNDLSRETSQLAQNRRDLNSDTTSSPVNSTHSSHRVQSLPVTRPRTVQPRDVIQYDDREFMSHDEHLQEAYRTLLAGDVTRTTDARSCEARGRARHAKALSEKPTIQLTSGRSDDVSGRLSSAAGGRMLLGPSDRNASTGDRRREVLRAIELRRDVTEDEGSKTTR